MSAIKLTLEDGREFEVGEVVEINEFGDVWEKNDITIDAISDTEVSLEFILTNPKLVRKLPPVREVPLTNDDVLEMLRKGGYEWKYGDNGSWYSGMYSVNKDGLVYIHGSQPVLYTAYRHTSDLIEHPMTKKDGVV